MWHKFYILLFFLSHPSTKFCSCFNKINFLVHVTLGGILMRRGSRAYGKDEVGRMKCFIPDNTYGLCIWSEGNNLCKTNFTLDFMAPAKFCSPDEVFGVNAGSGLRNVNFGYQNR